MSKGIKILVAGLTTLAMMGSASKCEVVPTPNHDEQKPAPAPVAEPRTARVEAWTEPDGPFNVAMLGKDRTGQVPPVRHPAEGGMEPVAAGRWEQVVVYTAGVPFNIELNVVAGRHDSLVYAKVTDGGNTSTRKGRGEVTLEWTTVQ